MKLLLPLLLLLCLELTLVCIHAEESSSMERNFNVEQISGYWFSIAEASDEREKIEEHGSMRAFVENITVLENSLVFKFHLIVNEECTEMTLIGEETEKAGIYYLNCREPYLSLDIKEKFAKLCEEHGIIRENIIDLTNVNRCLEARE